MSEHTKQKVAVVGVGRMGANMARRLKDVGYNLTGVYDQNHAIAEELATELETIVPETLSAVSSHADVIITVVSDDAAMLDIYRADQRGLFSGDVSGKLFINCATISPQVHIELMQQAERLNAHMLEVPMASSIPQARDGKLFLMVAGKKDTLEAAKPLLESLSSSLIYTGKPGSAASLKLLVNMVMNINTAALAEGLGLADALGLDLDLVRQVFAQTGANSRVLETDADDMQNRDHNTYFSAAHAAKDSNLALALGRSQGLPMLLAEATAKQYDTMKTYGLGELDKSGISELTFKTRLPKTLSSV